MVLTTERLILRPWLHSDANALYELARDPKVGHAAGWREHHSPTQSLDIIKTVLDNDESYAVCTRGFSRLIGAAALKPADDSRLAEGDTERELGYWIGRAFWGEGYGTEAAQALVERAFTTLACTRIWAGVYVGNSRSRRVLEKCGFSYVRTDADQPVELLGETRDEEVFVLER